MSNERTARIYKEWCVVKRTYTRYRRNYVSAGIRVQKAFMSSANDDYPAVYWKLKSEYWKLSKESSTRPPYRRYFESLHRRLEGGTQCL